MEDALYRLVGLYRKSPDWVKRLVGTGYGVIPYRIRYGQRYEEYRKSAAESRNWTKEQHQSWQLRKLQALVRYASESIPYYRRKFREAGVAAADLRTLDDMHRFPTLTREDIRQNFSELAVPERPGYERLYTATSGSSGVPLELFHHKSVTRPKERAFLYELWEKFGYRPSDRAVLFRGEVIDRDDRPWYYDPIDRHLVMSSYKLDATTLASYCEKIRRFRPAAIRGYPFVIYRLVTLMVAAGERPFDLKTVILESENVYPEHRTAIAEFFRCSVCHYFGHTERLVFGGNCPGDDAYHMHPQYGFLEVLDSEGKEVEAGDEGELVATGFDNLVMPLIRYRTQDFVVKGGWSQACSCGFPTLLKVNGRAEEFVLLRTGKREPFHNLFAGIHGRLWGMVEKLQCIQHEQGVLRLAVIPSPGNDAEQVLDAYKCEIAKRVSRDELHVIGEAVDHIPATRSGKTKLFIQTLPAEELRT